MGSRELILRLLANSLNRKLANSDVRQAQHRLSSLPSAIVNNTMMAFYEQQIQGDMQNLLKNLYRILLCATSYRYKMTIWERYTYYDSQFGKTGTYLCPRCGSAIEFDFQAYCSSCGQALDWDECENAKVRTGRNWNT